MLSYKIAGTISLFQITRRAYNVNQVWPGNWIPECHLHAIAQKTPLLAANSLIIEITNPIYMSERLECVGKLDEFETKI